MKEGGGDALFEGTGSFASGRAKIDLEVFSVRLGEAFGDFGNGIKLGARSGFREKEENNGFMRGDRRCGRDSEDTLEGFTYGFGAGEKGIPLLFIETERDERSVGELGSVGSRKDRSGRSRGRPTQQPKDKLGEQKSGPTKSPHEP